jgi:hypothetical protein
MGCTFTKEGHYGVGLSERWPDQQKRDGCKGKLRGRAELMACRATVVECGGGRLCGCFGLLRETSTAHRWDFFSAIIVS